LNANLVADSAILEGTRGGLEEENLAACLQAALFLSVVKNVGVVLIFVEKVDRSHREQLFFLGFCK